MLFVFFLSKIRNLISFPLLIDPLRKLQHLFLRGGLWPVYVGQVPPLEALVTTHVRLCFTAPVTLAVVRLW